MNEEQLRIKIENSREDNRLLLYNEDLQDADLQVVLLEICALENLVELGLSYNFLSKLPDNIANLTNLKELWVSKNQIRNFPLVITKLIKLQYLSLTYNQLNTLPCEIKKLICLKRLFLNHNQLKTIPPEIEWLANLERLDLYDNNIENLPPEIGNLSNLKILDLSNNNINELPPEIEKLTNLVVLNLCDNPIAKINKIGRFAKQGKGFYVDYNLPRIPDDILKKGSNGIFLYLTNTEKVKKDILQSAILKIESAKKDNIPDLDLSNMGLTEIPINIEKLVNLKQLDLENNALTTLPKEIETLINLERLYLRGNNLRDIPSQIGKLVKLKRLDLSKNSLQNIPPEIGNLDNLKELFLRENEIEYLPPEIGKLREIKRLELENNSLQALPSQIGELINLQELYLRNNKLTNLPDKTAQLKNLEKLYLEKNELNLFPNQILQLTRLQRLALDENNLQSIPDEIVLLTNLKRLSLSKNNLQDLPDIKILINLILLDLRFNPCAENFTKTHLKKQGAGVYTPQNIGKLPDEILQKKSWDIWYYLLGREMLPLNEVKLLIVGEAGVGKTCLVNRLLHDRFEEPSTTEGIDRHQWNNLETNGSPIRINIWDFSGQVITHSTHQFFLTKRSVYLLVLDARRGEQESRLEYWLKLIQSFGGDSPILIVINKIDEGFISTLNQRFLRNKYSGIVGFYQTSCLEGEGITELKTKIKDAIDKLVHIHDLIPKSWFKVKICLEEKLEQTHTNYISYQAYQDLCALYGITDSGSQDTLCGFLHDLGIILSFRNDERFDLLGEKEVLNPEWVTNAVYKLLNVDIFKNHGVFSKINLKQILDKNAYPTVIEHQFIIDMMQKFELCFPIPDTENYLIPELLQNEEPDLNWNKTDSLRFEYHYDILPHSVFSRFIVRLHEVISQQTYWRTGVVLAHDNNKALIKADLEDKKIFVWVTGNSATRRVLLGIIRKEFKHIHGTIKGLEAIECIPVSENSKVVITYDELLDLEKNKITSYYYPSIKQEINVTELLNGVEEESNRKSATENDTVKPPSKTDDTNVLLTRRAVLVWGTVALLSIILIAAKVLIPEIPIMLIAVAILLMNLGAMATVMPWMVTTGVLIATILLAVLVGAFDARERDKINQEGLTGMVSNVLDKLGFLSAEKKPSTEKKPEDEKPKIP